MHLTVGSLSVCGSFRFRRAKPLSPLPGGARGGHLPAWDRACGRDQRGPSLRAEGRPWVWCCPAVCTPQGVAHCLLSSRAS